MQSADEIFRNFFGGKDPFASFFDDDDDFFGGGMGGGGFGHFGMGGGMGGGMGHGMGGGMGGGKSKSKKSRDPFADFGMGGM